jgi:hypothetical protein
MRTLPLWTNGRREKQNKIIMSASRAVHFERLSSAQQKNNSRSVSVQHSQLELTCTPGGAKAWQTIRAHVASLAITYNLT